MSLRAQRGNRELYRADFIRAEQTQLGKMNNR